MGVFDLIEKNILMWVFGLFGFVTILFPIIGIIGANILCNPHSASKRRRN